MLAPVLALLTGYLLGSLPTAYLVARIKTGKSLSGNIGGLNTLRSLGWGAAIAVVAVDITKGALAVIIARYIFEVGAGWAWAAGIAAVAGHNWMVWLRFSGGKGMAAAIGVIAAVTIVYGFGWVLLAIIAIIMAVFFIRHNIVLGNAVALLLLPLLVWLATASGVHTAMAGLLLAVIVIKYALTALADYRKRGLKAFGRDELKPGKGAA